MEKIEIKTNPLNEHLILDKYNLFLYKCEERKVVGNSIIFTFSRDDSLPYIDELRKLEKEFGEYKIKPMWLTIISPIISFVLFTVFLILYFALGKKVGMTVLFPALLIPAIVFLLLGVIIMFIRSKMLNKIDIEKPIKEEEYRKKIEELVKKY